jgi:hypothetical protein
MNAAKDVLDSSIVEPMPPFPDLDRVLARERRRRRGRRLVAACGSAVALVAVLGVVAFVGTTLRAGPAPSVAQPAEPNSSPTDGPASPSPSAAPETVAETGARLASTFQNRLSTVVPGALASLGSSLATDFVTFDGYLTFFAKGTLSSPAGRAGFGLYALRPTPGATPSDPPGVITYKGLAENVFGGCAGMFTMNTLNSHGVAGEPAPGTRHCDERPGPAGSRVAVGQFLGDGVIEYTVTVVFADGSALMGITSTNGTGAIAPLTPDQLAGILADPSLAP